MAQFKYTLPSGKKFTMNAPEGTTQAQADYIFYSQVAAGSLVGFTAGQSISGTKSTAVKFALSRLDRGTAGVDDRVILSIVNGLPTISGIPSLINVPLQNPINQANIAAVSVNNTYTAPAIGPLNSNQVQGLLAQVANFINQPADVMTNETGVGQYGLNCQQLEQSGYVKPGTYQQFIFDPSPLTDVLSAPSIFTGKNGISSATDFLNSPQAQNDAMSTLMSNGYNSLTATGIITPAVTPSISALAGQVYTQSGLQTVSAVSAATGISFNVPSISGLSLANNPISNLLSTSITNPGSLTSGALNSVTGSFTNISSLASKLSGSINQDVGALITNSGCFGTTATALWSSSGGLGALTSSLPSINSLTSNLPSLSSLTSNLPDLNSLTTNIQNLDVLGKASQFATSFSNPLTSLTNLGNFNLSSLTSGIPSIGSLTSSIPGLSSLTAGLPSLSSLTSSLPDLGSLSSLTSSLPDLGSLGNFGSLTSLPGLDVFAGAIGGLFGGGGDSLVSSTQVAAGYSNTVNRATVDAAFTRILGDSKIPTATFDYPSPNSISLNASADITAAQNFLQGLRAAGDRLLTSAQKLIG
jgi:hypothetical protein